MKTPLTYAVAWKETPTGKMGCPTDEFWRDWRREQSAMAASGLSLGEFNPNLGNGDYELHFTPPRPILTDIPQWIKERLRDYQVPAVQGLVAGMKKGERVLDASETGLGKTFSSLATVAARGRHPFVVCRRAALPAWKEVGKVFGFDLKVGDNLINWESLRVNKTPHAARWEDEKGRNGRTYNRFKWKLSPAEHDIVWDECFPAGTSVSTPGGIFPIESLRVGDWVSTPNGARRIVRTIKTVRKLNLVKVAHANGTVICTPTHKFYTACGLIEAKNLAGHHLLWRDAVQYEAMPTVQHVVRAEETKNQILFTQLQLKVQLGANRLPGTNEGGVAEQICRGTETIIHPNDITKSDERSGSQETLVGKYEGAILWNSRRQWPRTERVSAAPVEFAWGRMDCRIRGLRDGQKKVVRTEQLATDDGRSWLSGIETSCGMRREISQLVEDSSQGYQKGFDPEIPWLDGDEIQERRDHCRSRRSGKMYRTSEVVSVQSAGTCGTVFDLEVEGEHCYEAGGCLVSNCHAARAPDATLNSKMHIASTAAGMPTLNLSATAANAPIHFRALGYALGLHHLHDFYSWLGQFGYGAGKFGIEWNCEMSAAERFRKVGDQWVEKPEAVIELARRRNAHLAEIHRQIFTEGRGVRLRKRDIANFPKTLVLPKLFSFGAATAQIQKAYRELQAKIVGMSQANKLAAIVAESVGIERLKMPTIAEEIKDAVNEGLSVAVFVNYVASAEYLCSILKTQCCVVGGQPDRVRAANIADFQANRQRVIICNVSAGGESISLHDTTGEHPRCSFIMPTYFAERIKQALGRIDRDGVRDVTHQTIPFAADTIEEAQWQNFCTKSDNIEILNDGDLQKGLNL